MKTPPTAEINYKKPLYVTEFIDPLRNKIVPTIAGMAVAFPLYQFAKVLNKKI